MIIFIPEKHYCHEQRFDKKPYFGVSDKTDRKDYNHFEELLKSCKALYIQT